MSPEILFIFFMSFVLLHIKPGPGQAFRIGCALDKGFASAFAVSIGVSIMCTIYFLIVALSYNNLIQYFESFADLFKILGGIYLIYLGAKGFIKQSSGVVAKRETPTTSSLLKFLIIGIIISLSNPMDIVFFLSILPNLIPLAELTTTGIVQGALIVFFTGMILDVFTLTLAILAKDSITDSPMGKYLLIFTNVVFILIGAFFIFSALFLQEFSLNIL